MDLKVKKNMNNKNKIGLILAGVLVMMIIHTNYNSSEYTPNFISREVDNLHYAETETLFGHSAFGYIGWSRNGDSIDYSFIASANIWVYAMDESQWFSFTEGNMLGTLLSTDSAGMGVFYPQYEARWYIVFYNYHSYSVTFDYDVIFSPIIMITKPTSATQIYTESDLLVTWDSYDVSGGITVDLYKGGSHITTLDSSTLNDGITYCTIPETCVDGNDYRIKLTAPSTSEVDYSSYFSIIQRKLQLSQPKANNIFVPYSKGRIDWYSIGISSRVKIDLYANSSFLREITNDTENDMVFLWNVWVSDEYAHITSSNYQIRIQDAINPKYFDISPNFTILSVRSLFIVSPTANTTVGAGDTLQVQWESDTPCTEVYIALLRGDIVIENVTARNTGSYDLPLSSRLGGDNKYKIQITAVDNSTSASSDFFTLIPKLRIPGYNITILFLSIICVLSLFYYKLLKTRYYNEE
jgi:hypothetical protein